MTPLLEFLVNERLGALRGEAERERLVRAAREARRGRGRPLGWLLARRPRAELSWHRARARFRLERGQA